MSNAIPTLGFASRCEAALALRDKGLKHHEIAKRLGVNESSVGNLVRQGRIKRGEGATSYFVEPLTGRQRDRLRREARKRGVAVRALVSQLLGIIVDDRLFAALLDVDGPNR